MTGGLVAAIVGTLSAITLYTVWSVKAATVWPSHRPQYRALARAALVMAVFGVVLVVIASG